MMDLRNLDELKEKWKGQVIKESTLQHQIAENEGIEFSMTGELIPLEIIEGDLMSEAINWKKWHADEGIKIEGMVHKDFPDWLGKLSQDQLTEMKEVIQGFMNEAVIMFIREFFNPPGELNFINKNDDYDAKDHESYYPSF